MTTPAKAEPCQVEPWMREAAMECYSAYCEYGSRQSNTDKLLAIIAKHYVPPPVAGGALVERLETVLLEFDDRTHPDYATITDAIAALRSLAGERDGLIHELRIDPHLPAVEIKRHAHDLLVHREQLMQDLTDLRAQLATAQQQLREARDGEGGKEA